MTHTHLAAAGRRYPSGWRQADELRAKGGKDLPDWPAWCFLPMAGWYAVVSAQHGADRLPLDMAADIQKLAAFGAWRPTQGIYRFDAELYDALISTPLDGDLPSEVLYRLPAWGVYVESPLLTYHGELRGFFAHLECDANSGAHELRLLFERADGTLMGTPLHIGAWSLAESLSRVHSTAAFFAESAGISEELLAESVAAGITQMDTLRACINLLLYLCSTEPDAQGPSGASYAGYPQAKKVKNGWRLFAPDAPTIWRMGDTVGEVIRTARTDPKGGTHAGPRPHIRRAHWHGFWSGTLKPREGVEPTPRNFKLKWLPPTAVALGDDDNG